MINTFVDYDSFEPSTERTFVFKVLQVLKSIDKTVLQYVFRIFPYSQHSNTNVVHRIDIEPVQFVLRVSIPGLAFFNKLPMRKTDIGFQLIPYGCFS